MRTKNCVICNTEFEPYLGRKNAKYCNPKCLREANIRRMRTPEAYAKKNKKRNKHENYLAVKKICEVCETEYIGKHDRKYCSPKCSNLRRNLSKRLIPTEKECIVCSSVFTHGRSDKKTCSAKCNKIHTKRNKKKFNKNIIKECVVCGNGFRKLNTSITCGSEECKTIQRKQYRNRWKKETNYYNDIKIKLHMRIGHRVRSTLRHKGILKNNRTFTILGFSKGELKEHLESQFTDGMSWDNMGEWHIDHIRPVASFNFDSVEHPDFKKCWALNNLQPLWAVDNMSKGDKWDGVVNA